MKTKDEIKELLQELVYHSFGLERKEYENLLSKYSDIFYNLQDARPRMVAVDSLIDSKQQSILATFSKEAAKMFISDKTGIPVNQIEIV
jgi:hypothetical protein